MIRIAGLLLPVALLVLVGPTCKSQKSNQKASSLPEPSKTQASTPATVTPVVEDSLANAWSVWRTIPESNLDELQPYLSAAIRLRSEYGYQDVDLRQGLLAHKNTAPRPMLELLAEGVSRIDCQYPLQTTRSTRSPESLTLAMYKLTEVQLADSILAAIGGQMPVAIDGLQRNLEFGSKLLSCEGAILSFTIAMTVLKHGVNQAKRYADDEAISAVDSMRLLSLVTSHALTPNDLVASVRGESLLIADRLRVGPISTPKGAAEYLITSSALLKILPKAVRVLEAATASLSADAVAEDVAKEMDTMTANIDAELESLTKPNASDTAALEAILAKHKNLLDADATTKLVEVSLKDIGDALESGDQSWPLRMKAQSLAIMSELRNELGPGLAILVAPNKAKSVSADTVERFLSVANPVGRLAFAENLGLTSRLLPRMLKDIAKVEASRRVLATGLAMCLYRQEHGKAPENLQTLVDSKILRSIPQDPHANRPLRYEPAEHRVWSIGSERENENGEGYESGDLTFACRE